MVLSVEFHPEARAEFESAVARYELERRGLGAAFSAAVRETVRRAAEHPTIGAKTGSDLRRLFIAHFPYAVLYALHEQRLVVVAVAHFRRRPGYWQRRI